ncbi:MAG: membrane protein [Chloroflexota bacterium]|nr:MAG: membrane protein [Chloroflexota bacterium]
MLLKKLPFPEPFRHEHPPVANVNEVFEEQLSLSQQAADGVARVVGSWKFIIIQSVILTGWVILNVTAWVRHWDPYPFILMNLVLSLQAAYTAPVIMMSQNRQAARDRLEAHNDYLINQKAEEEIRAILNHLAAQDQALGVIHQMLLEVKVRNDQTPPGSAP